MCVQVLLAHLPNIESTCRVCVSISFLSFVLHCIFNSNVNCFCVYKYSSSVFPEPTYIYCTVYSWLYTGKRWVFIVNCVFFFKRLCCKCFPCHCLHSYIMRPKFETHAHSEFHVCFLLFFSFSKSRSYSRGALQAWAGQFKPLETQYICKKHQLYVQHICYFCPVQKTELKLLSSIQTEMLSHHVTRRTVSCHPPFLVMHVHSVRLRVPLVPPVSKGALLGRKLLLSMVVSLMFHFFKRLSQY